MTEPDPIIEDCELDAPPQKVWRALTEPALVARWLAPMEAANENERNEASRFELKNLDSTGDVACDILDAEAPSLLRWSWRARSPEGDQIDSVVTFRLAPTESGGTHLHITQDQFVIARVEAKPLIASALAFSSVSNIRCAATFPRTRRARMPARGVGASPLRMAA